VKIRPALQDSFEIFIKKSSCLKSKPIMERLRSYSFKNCSSAKVTDLWRGRFSDSRKHAGESISQGLLEIGVNLEAAWSRSSGAVERASAEAAVRLAHADGYVAALAVARTGSTAAGENGLTALPQERRSRTLVS
jgi:hypothetical protein